MHGTSQYAHMIIVVDLILLKTRRPTYKPKKRTRIKHIYDLVIVVNTYLAHVSSLTNRFFTTRFEDCFTELEVSRRFHATI